MDITIGIQNTARELNLELEGTKEEITKDLKKQLSGELLELTDAIQLDISDLIQSFGCFWRHSYSGAKRLQSNKL